jgi:hypothetical protein
MKPFLSHYHHLASLPLHFNAPGRLLSRGLCSVYYPWWDVLQLVNATLPSECHQDTVSGNPGYSLLLPTESTSMSGFSFLHSVYFLKQHFYLLMFLLSSPTLFLFCLKWWARSWLLPKHFQNRYVCLKCATNPLLSVEIPGSVEKQEAPAAVSTYICGGQLSTRGHART